MYVNSLNYKIVFKILDWFLYFSRSVARDIGGSDPERMAPPNVEKYIRNVFQNTDIKMEVISDPAVLSQEYPLFVAVDRAASREYSLLCYDNWNYWWSKAKYSFSPLFSVFMYTVALKNDKKKFINILLLLMYSWIARNYARNCNVAYALKFQHWNKASDFPTTQTW